MVTLLAEDGLLQLLAGVPVLLGERVPHPLDELPHEVIVQGHLLVSVSVEVGLDQRRQVSVQAVGSKNITFHSILTGRSLDWLGIELKKHSKGCIALNPPSLR